MAVLTLANMEQEYRDLTGDSDSSNYANDQATVWRFLNRAYCLVKGIRDDRPQVLSPTASGFITGADSPSLTLTNTKPIRRVLDAFLVSDASSTMPIAIPLERWSRREALLMQGEDPVTGQPSAFAVWRLGTATASSVGKWTVGVFRIPDAVYNYAIEALIEPTPLAAGTDKPDVDDQMSYVLANMAAVVGARLMGHPEEFIAELASRVPDALQAALAQMDAEYRVDHE